MDSIWPFDTTILNRNGNRMYISISIYQSVICFGLALELDRLNDEYRYTPHRVYERVHVGVSMGKPLSLSLYRYISNMMNGWMDGWMNG